MNSPDFNGWHRLIVEWGKVVGALGTLVTLLAVVWAFSGRITGIEKDVGHIRETLAQVHDDLDAHLRDDLGAIRERIRALEARDGG